MNPSREFLIQKRLRGLQILESRFTSATSDFHSIIDMIISKYHPHRIYQWGSLLHQDHFSEASDIDVAVEGITNAQDFFQMLSEAQDLTDFTLDLVQLEHIHPLHKAMIIQKGKLVYERD